MAKQDPYNAKMSIYQIEWLSLIPYLLALRGVVYCSLCSSVHLIIFIYRIMETVRQQNGVKYVAHNRVSEELPVAGHHVESILSSIGCTSCSN